MKFVNKNKQKLLVLKSEKKYLCSENPRSTLSQKVRFMTNSNSTHHKEVYLELNQLYQSFWFKPLLQESDLWSHLTIGNKKLEMGWPTFSTL